MWDFIFGLIALLLGMTLVFAGLRFFFATLPILGFILGFMVGGAGIYAIFGSGFFSSLGSIVAGLIFGVLFALISYFWWYAGALVAAGASGAALGTALIRLFNGTAEWLYYTAAIIGFIALVVVALVLALPVYIVLVNTAFVGATVVVGGVLLVFNQIDRSYMTYGHVVAIINRSWWWSLVVVAVAIVGIVAQMRTISITKMPENKWETAR